MYLSFVLGMPNCASWDGKWTGSGNIYARALKFRKSEKENAETILKKGYFYYNFGDGWGASVTVAKIDSKEAAKVNRKTDGFCGYDWMIESIKEHGLIKV